MTLTELFTAIANAIREKTGKTESIVAENFPSEIEAIETGSSVDTCTLTVKSNLGYASLSIAILVLNADGKIDVAHTGESDYVDIYTVNNAVCNSCFMVIESSMRGMPKELIGVEKIQYWSGANIFRITAPANGTASVTIA